MARMESSMAGSIPLSTLRARVEYGFSEASTPQGNIGVKVWMNTGDYLNKEEPELPPRVEGGGRRSPRRGPRGPRLG
jgi:small subunit ribosomal protein S3